MLAIRKKVLLISLIAAAAAIAAQERNNARLTAIDGVVGTAVGHGPEGPCSSLRLSGEWPGSQIRWTAFRL